MIYEGSLILIKEYMSMSGNEYQMLKVQILWHTCIKNCSFEYGLQK